MTPEKIYDLKNRRGLALKVYRFGNSGPALHFYHANGFSSLTYTTLLSRLALSGFTVYATDARGHGQSAKPPRIGPWSGVAEDLLDVLDTLGLQDVTAVGHSLGGVASIMASVMKPRVFRRVIALDPVIFNMPFLLLIAIMRKTGFVSSMPPVSVALRRRSDWPSREDIVKTLSRRSVFRKVSPEYLKNYAEHAFTEKDGRLFLSCPKELEAEIYSTIPLSEWRVLKKVTVPTLVIRGLLSDTLKKKAYDKVLRTNPLISGLEIEGTGHLFPMENEDRTLDAILRFAGP